MKNAILEYLLTIPKGKVVTYKYLSGRFFLHPRAVAKILCSNLEQDRYPCYKVINSNGKVGGYNLGVEEKIRRLENDGIPINDMKVDEKFIWQGE